MNEKKKKKKKWLIIPILLLILCAGLGAYKQTARGKILYSIIYFAAHTLQDEDYILYDIDIKELCREYLDGDLSFEGTAYLNDIANFGFSSSMSVEGVRAYSQKQLSCKADLDVLFLNVGEFDVYARDDTAYLYAPALDDMSFGFQMDTSLFPQAPMFNYNIDLSWFKGHIKDFWHFVNSIEVRETGATIDDDGRISKDYRITIHPEEGAFIFDLLGVETPDHEIAVDLYLTPNGHFRRMEADLDNIMPDTTAVIDGESVGNCTFTKSLPDNEKSVVTLKRQGEYTNDIDVSWEYTTNAGDTLSATCYATWEWDEDGVSAEVNDIELYKNEDEQLKAYFKGEITKITAEEDVLKDVEIDLDQVKCISWKKLRDDTQSFVDEVMDTAKAVIWGTS